MYDALSSYYNTLYAVNVMTFSEDLDVEVVLVVVDYFVGRLVEVEEPHRWIPEVMSVDRWRHIDH